MQSTITDGELEVLRKKARGRDRAMLLCTGVAALLILYAVWRLMAEEDDSLFVKIGATLFGTVTLSCGALAFFYWLLFKKPYQAFNNAFKSRYVLSTIQEMGIFGQLQYDPKGGFTHDDIRNAAVVACGDKRRFESEDLLSGRYQGLQFRYCDVSTACMKGAGNHRREETLFHGQVMHFVSFDEVKKSSSHLQIFEKKLASTISGWTAEHEIHTENEAFNRRFRVFAISFCGSSMFVAIDRVYSILDASFHIPVPEQKRSILEDVELLRRAGDLLVLEVSTFHPSTSH